MNSNRPRPSIALSGILLALGLLISSAEGRTWTDASGAFSVEAEFIALADGVVALKTPAGERIEIPLARLSDADREFAEAQAAGPGVGETNQADAKASGKLRRWMTVDDGTQKQVTRLTVHLELSGGIIPEVYAFADAQAEPMTVGDETISQKGFSGINFYKPLGSDGDPADGVLPTTIEFGVVPDDTTVAGPLKGSIAVCVGGEERVLVISDPLNRAVGPLESPFLTAMGIGVDFVRHGNANSAAFLVDFDRKDVHLYAGLEIVSADGKVVKKATGSASSGDRAAHSISIENHELEGNTLRLRLRDGGRQETVAFEVETIAVEAAPE